MSASPSNILTNTVQDIFARNEGLLKKERHLGKKTKRVPKRELELALTVMLVDLASCDQKFEPEEYQIISDGLRRLFGTTKSEVTALVNQANTVIANLRGTSRFAEMLKENLTDEDRHAVMEVIDEVIGADGKEDGFETYLRHKFASILGVPIAR